MGCLTIRELDMSEINGRILPDQTQGNTELLGIIAELQAKLARATKPRKTTLKVTEKGGLSMYGLGRFPITLYRGQWERLLDAAEEIKSFIADNAEHLTVKE